MTQTSATQPVSEPTTASVAPPRMRASYTPTLALLNIGIFLAFLTPVLVSMAFKVQHVSATQEEANVNLGLVLAAGGLLALFVNPLAGRLSDRTTSRWGMRRPWVLGGAVLALLGSALVGVAPSIAFVVLAWCVTQVGLNAVMATSVASIPDQVPVRNRGLVGGILGIAMPIGVLTGSWLMTVVPDDIPRFVIPAAFLLVVAIIFAVFLKDRHLTAKPAKLTAKEFFGSFVFNPVKYPDLGWTWLTKFLIMFGYAGLATFLPYYLTEKFGLPEQEAVTIILFANIASMVGVMISAPVGGWLSDRVMKRRVFVTAAGVVMAIGILLLAFAPDVTTVVIANALIGLGQGAFLSVDMALATEVLPNVKDMAKDLGVLQSANSLPQALAPAVAPAIIAAGALTPLGGYTVFYIVGAVIALAGALLVYRIKGVK